VYVPCGARLEWRRRAGQPGELKVKKVVRDSPAASMGYRADDEVIAIGSASTSDQDLDGLLALSRESTAFRVRRKKEELEVPPLFKAPKVLRSAEHALKPGDRAPSIDVFLSGGKPRDVLSVLEGRVVLVSFWATWCQPCLSDMPVLDRLQDRYGGRGLTVLAVSVDEDTGAAQAYLKEHPPAVKVIRSGGMKNTQLVDWRIEAIPLTILVDRGRRVAQVLVGYAKEGQEDRLGRAVETLLDASDPPVMVVRRGP
jgi:thiol-disulfide isomerase/thioredoxin